MKRVSCVMETMWGHEDGDEREFVGFLVWCALARDPTTRDDRKWRCMTASAGKHSFTPPVQAGHTSTPRTPPPPTRFHYSRRRVNFALRLKRLDPPTSRPYTRTNVYATARR